MKEEVKVFKSLNDQNRLRILKMLEVKPMCVCEITFILKLAPSTVSKHLSLLEDAGMISEQKEGKWVTYFLEENPKDTLTRGLLELVRKSMNTSSQIISDRKAAKKADRKRICQS